MILTFLKSPKNNQYQILPCHINAFSIITMMIIENRALLLVRSFTLSRYNHHVVIITLKASSFQIGSQIF